MRFIPLPSPRLARTGFAIAALVTGGLTPTGAGAAPLVGSGKWLAPLGGYSYCEQVATTTVRCTHIASAGSSSATTSTCRTEAVEVGRIAVIGACEVSLSGVTSGLGRVVADGHAPGCVTTGLNSGTLYFTDSDGITYTVSISIANFGGMATFSGYILNSGGLIVGRTQGTLTMACGGLNGSFKGTFELI